MAHDLAETGVPATPSCFFASDQQCSRSCVAHRYQLHLRLRVHCSGVCPLPFRRYRSKATEHGCSACLPPSHNADHGIPKVTEDGRH
eukprot:9374060-Pyramimonas_sp.AAC.1